MTDVAAPQRGWSGRPQPTHVIAHLSDTHIIAGGVLVGGHADAEAHLRECLDTIRASGQGIDAIVVSGDLVDQGDAASYELFAQILRPFADELGAPLVLTGGNHDERATLAQTLFADDPPARPDDPCDRTIDVNGLRLITLDSALPGSHAGGFSDDQYRWLAMELATPAKHGTILVMHHPPVPYRSPIMQLLDFDNPERLAAALAGTDVRAILCGHLHVTTNATLSGIPVHVAGGVSYVDDVGSPGLAMRGIDSQQSWNLVEVHTDTVVSTVVPARRHDGWEPVPPVVIDYLEQLDPQERRVAFATKR